MENRLNCDKNIKSKLVNTRKIIQNKFKKARKIRAKRERKLKERYKPITTAIKNFAGSEKSSSKCRKNDNHDDIFGSENDRKHRHESHSSSDSDDLDSDNDSTFDSIPRLPVGQAGNEIPTAKTNDADIEIIAAPSTTSLKTPTKLSFKTPTAKASDSGFPMAGPSTQQPEELIRYVPYPSSGIAPKVRSVKKIRDSGIISLLSDDENDTPKIVMDAEMREWLKRNRDKEAHDVAFDNSEEYEDDDDDVLMTISADGKRKKLQKSRIYEIEREVGREHKRRTLLKDRESARIHNIRAGAEDNAIETSRARRDQIYEIVSGNSEDTTDDDDNVVYQLEPNRASLNKRKNADVETVTKFIRTNPTPVKQKQLALFKVGTKPQPYFVAPRRKKIQNDPSNLSGLTMKAYETPFLTKEHVLYRAFVPPEPDTKRSIEALPEKTEKKKTKKAKTSVLKKGGNIEADFIPYTENVTYEHYKNPNDLVDRLRLLIASRAAGNSNHAQEINSLVAELRQTGHIM